MFCVTKIIPCQPLAYVDVPNIKLGFSNLFNLLFLDSGADVSSLLHWKTENFRFVLKEMSCSKINSVKIIHTETYWVTFVQDFFKNIYETWWLSQGMILLPLFSCTFDAL